MADRDPKRRTSRRALAASGLLAGLGALTAARVVRAWSFARGFSAGTHTPQRSTRRLLIAGDSTGVGVGAPPEETIAGRAARTFAEATIANVARTGARFVDVPAQLGGEPRSDVVLILAGGNDVLRVTRPSRLQDDVAAAIRAARRLAPLVVVMPAGNVGGAPFFLWPVSRVLIARARSVHGIVERVCRRERAVYVRLFHEPADDPFARAPGRYFAKDGIHPSGAGHGLWYIALLRAVPLGRFLRVRRAVANRDFAQELPERVQ